MKTQFVPIAALLLIGMVTTSTCATPTLVSTTLPTAAPTLIVVSSTPATVPTNTPESLPTATQAPPTDTPPPTATLVLTEMSASVEDVVGVWATRYAPLGGSVYIQYRADGTWVMAKTVAELKTAPAFSGTFKFEGTQFITDDSDCGKGTYDVRVKKAGNQPVELTFAWIDDPCRPRRSDLGRGMKWVGGL